MSFSKQEFEACLNELELSQVKAAELLSVNIKTVKRWAKNPNKVSGPAEQVLRAWLNLHHNNLPWRPSMINSINKLMKKLIKFGTVDTPDIGITLDGNYAYIANYEKDTLSVLKNGTGVVAEIRDISTKNMTVEELEQISERNSKEI